MSFNIMDLVNEQFSEQVMGQMSGLLGEEPDRTSSAISGAVPAILSGLGSITSNERGAESLFNTVQAQDDNLLDNLGDMLGGDESGSMIEIGTKLLGGLMGNGGLGSLVGVLAGFSGMDRKSSSGLIGIIAPIVLGILKRKLFSGDAGGGTIGALTSLFSDQKDNIQASMPAGLNDQLTSGGFFDNISDNFTESTQETTQAAQEQVSNAATGGSSLMRKLLPLIVLAILGWLALQFFSGKEEMEQTSQTEMSTDMDFGEQVGTMFQNTTDTFGKITDVPSATEQLPNLENLVKDFTGFSTNLGGVDDTVRGPIITLAKDAFSELQPVVDETLAIPGVGDIIKPATDSLIEQITKMLEQTIT